MFDISYRFDSTSETHSGFDLGHLEIQTECGKFGSSLCEPPKNMMILLGDVRASAIRLIE